MTEITCPACGHVCEISISGEAPYPFRCRSCLGLYCVSTENGLVITCEPLTESGYARLKQARQGHKHIS